MSNKFAICLLLIPLSCAASDVFQLDQLMKSADKNPAPPSLQKHMTTDRAMREALLACKKDPHWTLGEIEDFFAAKRVTIGAAGSKSWLVFPTTYCPTFFTNRSVPFWIMEQQADGSYRELYSASQDELELLASRSNGYRDLSAKRGFQPAVVIRFNGTTYR
jgi:hypothetical protein